MKDEYVLSKLSELNLDISSVEAYELSMFLDLASFIKKRDYDTAIEYVNTRNNLKNASAWDKFKYLCGYLQRIKKIYQYQNKNGQKNRKTADNPGE